MDRLSPLARPHRRAHLAHVCPECRQPWALAAVAEKLGYVVTCGFCSYRRPLAGPDQDARPELELVAD